MSAPRLALAPPWPRIASTHLTSPRSPPLYQRLFEQQEAKRKHLQDYIDKHAQSGENGPKAAAQRKSRMKKMERLGIEGAKGGGKFKVSACGGVQEAKWSIGGVVK